MHSHPNKNQITTGLKYHTSEEDPTQDETERETKHQTERTLAQLNFHFQLLHSSLLEEEIEDQQYKAGRTLSK
jgi:hypothetical protein